MRELLAGLHPYDSLGVARETGRPLSGPAHGRDHSMVAPVQVVAREAPVRGAPVSWREAKCCTPSKALFMRGECAIPLYVVNCGFFPRVLSERQIHPPDILQDMGVFLAGVPEPHGPFDCRVVRVVHGHTPHFQAGLWIGPAQNVLGPRVVESFALLFARPFREPFRRRLTVVRERERQARLGVCQMLLEPCVFHELFIAFRGKPRTSPRCWSAGFRESARWTAPPGRRCRRRCPGDRSWPGSRPLPGRGSAEPGAGR